MTQPYPLDRMLPASVFTHRTERSQRFINYPVFSWPWFWRRACFFGPFGLLFGTLLAIPLGAYADDHSIWVGSMIRLGPAWLFIMVFGTALGTWVRHRNFEPSLERKLIVLAVLIGVAAGYGAKVWYDGYLSNVVTPVLRAKGVLVAIPMLTPVRSLQIFYEVFMDLIVVSTSGGRALYNYFTELRRWESHGANQEVQVAKQQRADADRRLAVLQAQVEPHFLYNTLASVRSLVRGDPDRAEATIDALVDHLRATLPKFRDAGANSQATLADQLEICRSYLEVMRVRMGDRFRFSIAAPSEVAALSFPPLMLVPLVENAIKHGVERKPGPCSITIRASRLSNPERMEVTVVDDGAGLREGPSEGVGIANIREQLDARFGDRASIQLTAREAGGAMARIVMPIDPS